MEIISRLTNTLEDVQCLADLTNGLEGPYDLGFLYVSSVNPEAHIRLCSRLKEQLGIKQLLSCSCAGIIGSQEEIERQTACSLILTKFSDVSLTPFYCDQARLDELTTPEKWYSFFDVFPNEKPSFLVLPDPFAIDLNQFLKGVDEAYPGQPVIGGLASGATQAGGNTLILNGEVYTEGLIGVHLRGNIHVEAFVAQGCRPIGKSHIVTRGEGNIIHELGGQPFYQVLEETLLSASQQDRKLAQDAIFLGIVIDEAKKDFKQGDFLIRLLMGLDKESGAGAIADYVKPGQTIQFHIRDAVAATEDLNRLLRTQQAKFPNLMPSGALVFSCTGRGENMFHMKNHDIGIIQNHLGKVAAAGFFSAGEIGPVGGKNLLHGFASSIALFYTKQ